MHLGQPRGFARAISNVRRSWLSRESLLFGAFTGLVALRGLLKVAGWLPAAAGIIGWAALAAGIMALAATTAVYRLPARPAWGHWTGQAAFGLTALTAGPALACRSRPHGPARRADVAIPMSFASTWTAMTEVAPPTLGPGPDRARTGP
jgi:DMSO reductase anchor subunit